VIPTEVKNDSKVDYFHTAYEIPYQKVAVSNGLCKAIGLLPALVCPENAQLKMLITEAGVEDYPGIYLTGGDHENLLNGTFAAYPTEFKERISSSQEFKWKVVTKRANHIAKTNGSRKFPWRIIVIAEDDKLLAETDIVLRLSGQVRIPDPSWIKPGKSTSEWLYSNHVFGVDFKAGYNTDTYKYYIDLARQFGLEYVLFDAGWSNPNDVFAYTPEMDMVELTRYARKNNVGLVLWTSSIAMEAQMDRALKQFHEWGIKGIMVDFFNRDDQLAIQSLQNIAEKAAEKKIFVDYHGVSKPEGIRGKYPNVLTREGLLAYENYKWSTIPSPEYEVTIPFVRMAAGPVDYEPGAMRNATKSDFYPVYGQPMSMGTRIHQLAMFIVYESPYSKMGGNPSDYLKEPEYTQFIADIPTVWDETTVLKGKVSDYIVTLRKSDNGDYYIGAMTDWTPREIEIDLSFLEEGMYDMVIYQDGINADTYASDYKRITSKVTTKSTYLIKMAPGGGWVAHLVKIKP
jgi:alpha-glucosidase